MEDDIFDKIAESKTFKYLAAFVLGSLMFFILILRSERAIFQEICLFIQMSTFDHLSSKASNLCCLKLFYQSELKI